MAKIKSFYHLALAFLGSIVFRRPSRRLFVVGITGTKGKSTVIELINAILESAGKKTALLSSVRKKVGGRESKNVSGNTMPGRFAIQSFLREATDAGCDYALIEVTSQGVLQFRHQFIDWNAAIFTNLAPEHIEAHGSFEKYRDAKVRFFKYLNKSKKQKKYFFINEEDANHRYFEEAAKNIFGSEVIFFSRERFIKEDLWSHYDLNSKESRRLISEWLLADFNLENASAAVSFARSQNISWGAIKKALENFKGVPGRLEFIQKTPFAVVIDYVHTPDSLKKVYEILEPSSFSPRSQGEMICVLGSAGGGRDKWKRPEMGKIAASFCDKIILTNEDPYDENPSDILKQIENGFLEAPKSRVNPQNYFKILDRRQAIKKAISLAKKGDVVVITGKGSEQFIHLEKGKKIPWNEKRAVEDALKF
ncbi:MAG: UDP-N-acetylmuramoyl-L-alanyl-D-glutamate--2,6-diaminopimelate ligase [Patescibacteria group bacterium]|nr:UDP-N-acetylmuramoyl-L-alanyl-D-glutamate--2,6-diaminopimelate ligase [Patescibacteria group bacterium]